MNLLKLWYFIKSLFVNREKDKEIFKDKWLKRIKNPKEVFKVVLIFFFVSLMMDKIMPRYYKLFFIILLIGAYAWKRFRDGDYRYWYYEKTGERKYG